MAKTSTKMPRNAGYDGVTVHTVKLPLWPYLVTPASAIGLWAATAGAHAYWGGSPAAAGGAAVGLTLAGTALTGLTWRAAAPRGVVRRIVATTSALAGSAWTIGAMLAGPWERPWLDLWLIGAPTATIAMAVIRVLRSGQGDGEEGGGLIEAVKSLRGARIGRPKVDGARATAPVILDPGTPVSALAADRASLASALDVRETAVRVVPDADSARRARVEVVPVDQLRDLGPWPGLSAPGGSIADPMILGRMEDGEPLRLWLPGDHDAGRNATHVLVVGMSGAGKTELLLTLAAETLSRVDAELWFGDPRKGDQLPGWLRQGAARIATSETDVEEMLDCLPGDIARRAKWLGERGHKQWTPEASRQGMRYRVVIVDEAARIAAGNAAITELTESARSAGISLVFGLQRATYDRFPTSARANIGAALVLGVNRDEDAQAALSEATLDAGAAPWTWGATHPGYLYAEVPGTDTRRWSMPSRTYSVPESDRAAAVAPYITAPATDGGEQAVTPEQAAPEQRPDEVPEINDALDLHEPPDDVDPAQPITIPADMPRLAFGSLRTPPMGTEEARAWTLDYLLRLHSAGHTQVRPAELGDVIEATGLTASWVAKELRRLSSGPDAILQRTDRGVYRLRPPQPT